MHLGSETRAALRGVPRSLETVRINRAFVRFAFLDNEATEGGRFCDWSPGGSVLDKIEAQLQNLGLPLARDDGADAGIPPECGASFEQGGPLSTGVPRS